VLTSPGTDKFSCSVPSPNESFTQFSVAVLYLSLAVGMYTRSRMPLPEITAMAAAVLYAIVVVTAVLVVTVDGRDGQSILLYFMVVPAAWTGLLFGFVYGRLLTPKLQQPR